MRNLRLTIIETLSEIDFLRQEGYSVEDSLDLLSMAMSLMSFKAHMDALDRGQKRAERYEKRWKRRTKGDDEPPFEEKE